MIRQPISGRSRFLLGAASIVVLCGMYTWLSAVRQAAARRDQQQVALKRLDELKEELSDLQADPSVPEAGDSEATKKKVAANAAETERFQQLADHPDKVDQTVPSWSMLWHDGLLRACTPQGNFKRKELWLRDDFWATGKRLFAALLIGILTSVVLGIFMGCFDPAEAFLMPPFALLSKVPATAVLPIFFVVLQINFWMFIAIIAFGIVPSLAQAISASVRKDVPEELIFKAYTLGASQAEIIWNVVVKQVLPRVLDVTRLQLGPALVLLVAAEWTVASEGIGYRLRLFFLRTDMTVVFVYVALLGMIGLALDYGLIWLRRKLCPWFGE